ncbi:spore germination protein [Paenibacillus allorhizosphaerae]|uniref:Spore germination protein B1 n=1 Tax=Paenibacillus allorhizosphaerae TaxID=2849866 RepID=A0ABN7TYM9_9BACL|nr:spore germination protein [Paenibacillus allorhizosphaerae]CAG7655928.1 Spore germination protein B1 [Paenibacillus allorhizosphaerae]
MEASSPKQQLLAELTKNLQTIKSALGNSTDIIIKEIPIGSDGSIPAGIIYTDGLADAASILEALMLEVREAGLEPGAAAGKSPLGVLKDFILAVGDVREIADYETLYTAVLSGDTVILLDGCAQGLAASKRQWKDRGVTEPSAQTVVRGPKEGFSESLRTNTALVRRRIKDPHLWLETMPIGRVTKTDVAVMYIKGIANEDVLREVKSRLNRIDIDGILESGYVEELIQDVTFTPFPTIFNTERPDAVAADLLEGKIAILVDGTPFAMTVPALFIQFFQASEDYYQRWDFATLLRILRFLSLFIALLAPSLYIAITTFHQELLPTPLLIGLAAQREGIPFPAFIEAVMMELTFEILREAGVRMPRAIGQSVSIVGTLVIGQAAVEAGLVSPAMVIVVAITAISNFVIPAFNMGISIRIIRFGLMGLAATFGLFGITVGLVALVLHLCSLRSFGIPYMAPFAPFIVQDQKDSILRLPQWALFSRPRLISQNNMIRERNNAPAKSESKAGP